LAGDIKKKLVAKVCSFGHFTLTLSLLYCVKCRSRSLAIDNNEFLAGSVCVGSEITNWIATNAIGNYYHSKSHTFTSHCLHFNTCSKCPSAAQTQAVDVGTICQQVTAWLTRPTRC